jgi:4-hydroxy-tetrahydrodipicolinate synthase
MFEGTYVALVTPFRGEGVDRTALVSLLERLLEAGVDGIVPCGTTGESPTLSAAEHREVVELTVSIVAGRARVIAGAGSNCTAETVELTRHAAEAGADGALLIAPYYNKPTQEGLYKHFARVAEHVELPIVLYNAPGRCGVEIAVPTIVRLRRAWPHIVAVKHATGSMDGASMLLAESDIQVLSGDDSMTLPLVAVGAVGVISVIANLLPREMVELVRAARGGDLDHARELHRRLFPLAHGLLALETNPVPIKTALSMVGWCGGELRLPLCPMSEAHREQLQELLRPWALVHNPARAELSAGKA